MAIGDGGNDLTMLQEAHVGIGLFGKEGNLAAYSADYGICDFKALRRLLFWHGRPWAYRILNYSRWSLFKMIMPCICWLFMSE